jgi:uncharacterized protein (DUF1697 family)
MDRFVLLLRGVNVGGKNKVSMEELKMLLVNLGCANVSTLLTSGNAVFSKELKEPDLLSPFAADFMTQFGFQCEFQVLSEQDILKCIDENPFPEMAKDDPSHLIVHFVATSIEPQQIDEIGRQIQGPEQIRYGTRALYIAYPEGIGSSQVSRTPGWSKLFRTGTGRNWSTVLKLRDLLASVR